MALVLRMVLSYNMIKMKIKYGIKCGEVLILKDYWEYLQIFQIVYTGLVEQKNIIPLEMF